MGCTPEKSKGLYYPEARHGPFTHICAPKQKSGATWFTIPMASTSLNHYHDTPNTLPPSSASFHNAANKTHWGTNNDRCHLCPR